MNSERKQMKIIIFLICSLFLLGNMKIDVKAGELKRRNEIRSTGNIRFENGEVYVTSSDLIYLADEIDVLESTYKCNLVDALNMIGTYFRNDGSITYDNGQNEVNSEESKKNLSFWSIKQGILCSQSVDSVRQVQATDKDGNPLFYASEEAHNNGDNLNITTADSGFPLYYKEAESDSISAGSAAWVNGSLIKGNGEDNRKSWQNGYNEGYTKGVADSIGKANIVYSYHQHEGNSSQVGGCYSTLTGTSVISCGCSHYSYDKDENGHTRCGNCYHNHGGDTCSYPKGYQNYTYIGLICGKTEQTIESATIVY